MPRAKRQSLYYAAFRLDDNYQEVELSAKTDKGATREANRLLRIEYGTDWEVEVWRRIE